MRRHLLLAFTLLAFSGKAQLVDVAIGTVDPFCLIQSGNYIYIAESNANRISKIDITQASTTPIVYTGLSLNTPSGFALYGNDLYIAEALGNKISKFDITAETPVLTNVITGLQDPVSLSLNGTVLYIAERGGNKISKIDITDTTPVAVDVITNLSGPRYIGHNGIDMYICENIAHKISRFTMADAVPVVVDIVNTGVANGIMINGDELYICETGTNKITKINLLDAVPAAVNVVTGVFFPVSCIVAGNELYIAEFGADKVSKLALPLGVAEILPTWAPALFPNPSSGYFSISNLDKKMPIQLYDMRGRLVLESHIGPNDTVNVTHLAGGTYQVVLGHERVFKYIKQ